MQVLVRGLMHFFHFTTLDGRIPAVPAPDCGITATGWAKGLHLDRNRAGDRAATRPIPANAALRRAAAGRVPARHRFSDLIDMVNKFGSSRNGGAALGRLQ
jgi:hypothetical protein